MYVLCIDCFISIQIIILVTRCPIAFLNNNFIIFPFFFMLDFFILNIMITILEDSFQSFKQSFKIMTKDSRINIIEMIKKNFSFSRKKQNIAQKYIEKNSLKDLSNQTNRFLEYFATVSIFRANLNLIYYLFILNI